MMNVAERMSRLGTETAFEVLAKAKALEAQGKHIVHLEIGEPDFDTPTNIREAAKKALDEGWTHYGPSNGLPDLRKAISEEINKSRGIITNPDMVVVTPGAKPIMFYSILVLVNEGDEVIYPNPGFPIYESMINFVGGTPVALPIREEKEFSIDLNELKGLFSNKTKLIILNYPHNPTGGSLSKADLIEIAILAKKYNCWVLADEVYTRIIYEGKFESISAIDGMMERTIILDGFSKTYAMTGWRMGYGVMPIDLAKAVTKMQVNCASCVSSFSQRACIEALIGPQDASVKMVAEFKKRRDFIVDGLNDIPGFKCVKPKGAFYVFPNIKGIGKTSSEMETLLLYEANVATLSGTAFGKYGEGYIRLSYANSIENIDKALKRIKETVKKIL